ncbi:MAG: glycosyltransferase family 4 protein [Myxococcales bacterium]|nr:glycosyltransferase family 4 protein [Myxococcales bacterium]
MKVLVDAREAVKVATGVGVFVRYLARALDRSSDERIQFEIWPAHYDEGPETPRHKPFGQRIFNLLRNLWDKQVIVPFRALVTRADSILVLDPIIPLLAPCPVDVLIHDLQSFDRSNPKQDSAWARYITLMTKLAKWRARYFFTNSDTTRADVLRVLGVAPDHAHRTYPGVKPEFHPVTDARVLDETRAMFGLNAPFILVVGTTDPKRNFPRILEAFVKLRKDPARRERLICVGPKTAFFGEVADRIQSLGLGDEVRFTGFVPSENLAALYSLASVYLYPSLFEGFGFTTLEAMACGCPVITSNCSSLPEVVGDAGVLVDPKDVDAIFAALIEVLDQPEKRRDMIARGLARAATFRWESTAERIREVLSGT